MSLQQLNNDVKENLSIKDTDYIIKEKEFELNFKQKLFKFYIFWVGKDKNKIDRILFFKDKKRKEFIGGSLFTNGLLDYIYMEEKYRRSNFVVLMVMLLKQENQIKKVSKKFLEKEKSKSFRRNYKFGVEKE